MVCVGKTEIYTAPWTAHLRFSFFVYKWPSIFLHGDIVETGKERPDTRDLEVEEEKEIEG